MWSEPSEAGLFSARYRQGRSRPETRVSVCLAGTAEPVVSVPSSAAPTVLSRDHSILSAAPARDSRVTRRRYPSIYRDRHGRASAYLLLRVLLCTGGGLWIIHDRHAGWCSWGVLSRLLLVTWMLVTCSVFFPIIPDGDSGETASCCPVNQ